MVEIVADEVRLHIEDELPGQALGSRLDQLRRVRFGGVDLEHVGPINLFHREEGCGHTATRRHELPAAQTQLLAVLVGKLKNPPLNALLRFALSRRKKLSVGDNLGRYRRCSSSFFGSCNKAHFSVAEPSTHRDSLPIYGVDDCRGAQLRPMKLKLLI